MTSLVAVGLVALAFGVGAYYASDGLGIFSAANLLGGGGALLLSAVLALRRARRSGARAGRARELIGVGWVLAAIAVAMGAEIALDRSGLAFDWTADTRYTIAPATRAALAELPGRVTLTFFHDAGDNRARSTRMLLQSLARAGPIDVQERILEDASAEADRYGVGASNTVVVGLGDRFELVERPTEGTLWEALQRLASSRRAVLYVARGEGEGNLEGSGPSGFSALAAALQTEGYTVRDLVMPALERVPDDAAAVLVLGPRRPLRDTSLAALEAYLERGGRLVAMLEPGVDSGLEALLERWGFGLPDGVVVDPASGPVQGDPPGVDPIVFQYADHPVVRGLDPTRMTFFVRARPVLAAHKPEPDDELRALAFSSKRAWVARDTAAVQRGLAPERPPDASEGYQPILSVGRFPRAGNEARIVVFGDADFATNHYLRALYNLDLVMNAVHWATARDSAITIRPKALTPDQFPLTPQQSLQMLYGVGLLIPEACLIIAALLWARRRHA